MAVLLGRTTAGTTADFSAGGNTAAWKFVAVASGDLATIFAEAKVANTATSGRLGIYSHDSGTDRPANASPLGVATVTLANFNGSAVCSATLGATVAVTSGTTYWLAWFSGGADNHNFQGDSSGSYFEATGDFPAVPAASWSGPSTVNAIIWGESAGGAAPVRLLGTLGAGT